MSDKIQADDVIVAYTLECSQCGDPKEASGATSSIQAAQDFNGDGWKVIDGEPWCPDCQDEPEEPA